MVDPTPAGSDSPVTPDSPAAAPPPPDAAVASRAPCCSKSDAASAAACELCQRPVCRNCQRFVNLKCTCLDCLKKILAEIEAQRPTARELLPAVAGGLLAATLCGAVWAAIVVATDMVIGYAAVGVGIATGYGVLLGARRKRGSSLQRVAAFCALVGLALGKYFTVAHYVVTRVPSAKGASYIDPRVFQVFVGILPKILSPFDLLWVLLALGAATRLVKPADIRVTRQKVAA
jgi:hypothetical protein